MRMFEFDMGVCVVLMIITLKSNTITCILSKLIYMWYVVGISHSIILQMPTLERTSNIKDHTFVNIVH